MNFENMLCSKKRPALKDKYCLILYKKPRIDKYMETESRTEMTRGLETGNKLLFNRYRISVCGDGNIPEIDSGNGYTIL